MTKMLPRRLMIAALLAVGTASSAQAVNFIEVDGTSLTFFYDADFWGLGSASVSGNKISFVPSDDFDIKTKSTTASGSGGAVFSDYSGLSVFAVAKTGYSVSSYVQASSSTSVSFTTGSGVASGGLSGDVLGGYYNGDNFVSTSYEGSYGDGFALYTGTSITNAHIDTDGGVASNYFSATGVSTGYGVAVGQNGKGAVHAAVTDVSYTFSVTAVPEPETYAMMIAGLGLVGFAARRRKNAA